MKHSWKRLLSVLLVLAMLFALTVPGLAVNDEAERDERAELERVEAKSSEALTLSPIDAATLNSLKLGEKADEAAEAETEGKETAVDEEPAETEPTDEEPVEEEEAVIAEGIEMDAHSLAEIVRVSIVLDQPSTIAAGYSIENIAANRSAMSYRAHLRSEQAAMTRQIEEAIGTTLDVKWNLTLAMNAISANVRYGDIETIKALPGVAEVVLENLNELDVGQAPSDEPQTGTSTVQIGSSIAWDLGYTGVGSKVAVIDTGADVDHRSLDAGAFEYAIAEAEADGHTVDLLTEGEVANLASELNVSVDPSKVYLNSKIPYAYNYVDGNYDVIHLNDTQGEHGSHVAGIATANRYVPDGMGGYVDALTEVGVRGVAPDAQLVVMKVFGSGGGAYDSDYMVAIEDAIILGCDSANLSLGSASPGFAFSGTYESTMNLLVEKGTVVAVSAGNSGMWYDTPYNPNMYSYLYADDVNYHTGGSPGSFTNTLTSASVDNNGQTGMPIMFGELPVFYSETSYSNNPISSIASMGELEYVYIDSPGVDDNAHVGAEGDDFLALGNSVVSGKVAICNRGSSSFFAKANAAVAQGAVAVIIANNTDGTINMDLTGYSYSAPAVSITKESAEAIKAQSTLVETEAKPYYTGTLTVSETMQLMLGEVTDDQNVSSFSSYGVPGSLTMKPEIAAPGGSIYSLWGANKGSSPTDRHDAYELMSGTSMASPQTAGMAAVLGQYIREDDLCAKTGLSQRQLINSLLMSTAHPIFDSNGEYWPVIRVGAGLANVGDAVQADSYILMDEEATMFPDSAKDGKVKAELGDDPERTGEYSYTFTLYPLEESKQFTLHTDIFTQWLAGNPGYGMLQDTGTVILGADVSYLVNGEPYEDFVAPLDADVNGDGQTDEADAQAILDVVTGELDAASINETAADMDGDGALTSYDAYLLLKGTGDPSVTITEPTEITVNIALDEGDMEFLFGYFTAGFFVEGYTYVEPYSTEEGVIEGVKHSIPILGYCGSWTDPAVFDRTSVVDEAYGTGKEAYINNKNTNYVSIRYADGSILPYMGNPYAVEAEFPVDRLALSSASTIYQANFLPIRNLGTMGAAIQDENGKVLWNSSLNYNRYSAYYYVNGGAWQNIAPSNFNINKSLSDLTEGQKITFGFYGLPEYYAIWNAKENGGVATSGNLDAEGFKNVLEAGIVGDGARIGYTVTIDNTAPEVLAASRDLITGDITVTAKDNNYIAYIAVTNKSGSKVYAGGVPEQTEAGQEVSYAVDLQGQALPGTVVLLVADYAGNETAYQIDLGGGGAADLGGTIVAFDYATGNRWVELDPETLFYQNETTFDGIATFSESSVRVTAADYVGGYVFMAADDGYFYVADVLELDDPQRVGRYSDVTENIYDMAYCAKNKTLYALGAENTIYTLDQLTGEMTPVYKLTLNGTTGNNAVANKLAIGTDGTFYVANYGNTSAAKLFKFKPAAPVASDGKLEAYAFGFESDPAAEGWTFVDQDGDGYNWTLHNDTPAAYEGSAKIESRSYYSGALTPDNWAISPAVDLTGKTGAVLRLYAMNRMNSYPDTIAFYAGTSADPASMTKLGEDVKPSTAWGEYELDLSAFDGESAVYVAVRHYNCTDQFAVYVDAVSVRYDDPMAGIPTAEEVALDAVGVMGVYNYSYGGALAWDSGEQVLYLISNYNATTDVDHALWTVDTETGKATKVNSVNGSYSARTNYDMTGLFIIPGNTTSFEETDEATSIELTPDTLNILTGQSVELTAAVYPWTLGDKSVTFTSDSEEIATVDERGVVTGIAAGSTNITATSNAEPHLTATTLVTVEEPLFAELRGIIWDADGMGNAAVFNSNDTNNWTALGEVGQLRWGALVDDTVYGSTDDTMYVFDADTYEITTLGGIVSMWIPSDAAAVPADIAVMWGLDAGSRVAGICNGGTYFEVLNPVAGSLNYFDLGSAYSGDPMATLAYAGRDAADNVYYYVLTESGELWQFTINNEGSMSRTDLGPTGIDLTGAADVTNEVWASMVYDEVNDYLYLSHYDGQAESALLYAIVVSEPTRNTVTGDFNEEVWPVVGLYEYTPATDLVLKVDPTDVTLFEGETAQLDIKVKLGETNDFTVESADTSVATVDETGLITAVKAGTTTVTVTTVDKNASDATLSETVNVTVNGFVGLDAQVVAQISDGEGDHFVTLDLNDLSYTVDSDAPFAAMTASRTGDIYMMGTASQVTSLDAADMATNAGYTFDSWTDYPAQDIANYPIFINQSGEEDVHKALFTLSAGWLVTPDLYGWNLSSSLPDMAAIAFAGDYSGIATYYLLTTAGALHRMEIDYAKGSITKTEMVLDTGITLGNQSDASMTFVVDNAEENYGLVVADNGTKKIWFIDFKTNETGLLGTMDVDNIAGLVGYYDDQKTMADYVAPGPDPFDSANVVAEFDFEAEPTDWTLVDLDGDGYTWAWNHNVDSWFSGSPDFDSMANNGTGCILSASFINTVGALSPNNFAISPAIDLSGVTAADTPVLSFYAKGLDSNYAAENFAVYAGTSADPATITKIGGDFTATGNYKRYVADLSAFAGQSEVYVAIRHYNISDMYILCVDDVQVLTGVPITGIVDEPAAVSHERFTLNLPDEYFIGDGAARLDGTELSEGVSIEMEALPGAGERMVRPVQETVEEPERHYKAFEAVIEEADEIEEIEEAEEIEEIEEIEAEDESGVVDVPDNGTNFKRARIQHSYEFQALVVDNTAADGLVTIELKDDVDVTDGKITVTYDPEKLTYVDLTTEIAGLVKSVHVDETAGTVTFAYASADPITAETILATLTFSYDSSAYVKTEVTVQTTERNEDTAVDETEVIEIEQEDEGHDWDEPTYEWAEDNSTVTATRVCKKEASHVETETVDTVAVETPATCEEASYTTYTATFTKPAFEEQTKVVTTDPSDAIGHAWGEPEWTWAEDYSSATATFTCANDATHVETVDATVTSETADPDCENAGETVYTATVTFDGVEYVDEQFEAIEATGHTWAEPTWTWSDDKTLATASFICSVCGKEELLQTVPTSETTDPDCENDGETVYTATVTFEEKDYTDTQTETISAIGHSWDITNVEWAEDYSSVTVTLTCSNDESHTKSGTCTEIVSEVQPGNEPTCTETGYTTYSADFEIDGTSVMVSDTVVTDALGHTPGEAVEENRVEPTCETDGGYDTVVYCTTCGAELSRESTVLSAIGHAWETAYKWTTDNSTVIATATCKNDESHKRVELAETEAVTTDASCTEAGETVYTATFTDEIFETQTKTVVIEALGHTPGEAVEENRVEATCETAGSYDSVVYCTTCGAEISRETIVIEALGHTPGEAVEENRVEATCETAGSYDSVVYCTTCNAEISRETIVIEALGHDWGEPEWTWAEDNSSASATFTCKRDAEHKQTVEATVTSETEGRTTTYTATIELDGTTYTATHEETAPAGGGGGGGGGFKPNKPVKDETTPEDENPEDTTPVIVDKPFPFVDVPETEWYYPEIKEAYNKGLVDGVTDTTFEPMADVTRGMAVTILWRLAGKPAATAAVPFDDVALGSYYYDAVAWAASQGVVLGFDENTFGPNIRITREQFAAITYRYAQTLGKGFTGAWAFRLDFEDADQISDYAYEAMCWCTMNGIIKGVTETTLDPAGLTNRAAATAIFNRLDNVLKAE